MSSLVNELKNKRVLIGYVSLRGQMELVVARVLDVDENFVKITTDSPKTLKDEVTPPIVSYIKMDSVDNIVDVDDEEVYNVVRTQLKAMKEKQEATVASPPASVIETR